MLTNNQALIAAGNTGNNETIAHMGMRSVLLQWHVEDPVDDVERARNDIVFSHQGNRNPFIDHPEWVDCLYNNNCGGDANSPVFTYRPESVRFVADDASGLPHSSAAWTTFVASITATVTDDVDPNPQLTHNAPDPLLVGNTATIVTFTATDAANNSSTCVVVVRVHQ